MKTFFLSILFTGFFIASTKAQSIKLYKNNLIPGHAYFSEEKLNGKKVIRVIKDSTVIPIDEPSFVKLKDFTFANGTIEVELLSRFLPDAPNWARGFIGIAFRINEDNSKFESIYIRPSNGRAEDQIRRNHSIQYFAYPDYKFDRLRKEEPEKNESYADMQMNKWIKLRIVVKGAEARLYLDKNVQPSLVVLNMKHGANAFGSVGLWVETGTEGYFKNLKISK